MDGQVSESQQNINRELAVSTNLKTAEHLSIDSANLVVVNGDEIVSDDEGRLVRSTT